MRIMKCKDCGRYTLMTNTCPVCGGLVTSAHPPRFPESERMLELIIRERKTRRELEARKNN
ncbi:MAG: nucleolar RNA-binding Nop10p family protein [Nitrososphaerota archaeon]